MLGSLVQNQRGSDEPLLEPSKQRSEVWTDDFFFSLIDGLRVYPYINVMGFLQDSMTDQKYLFPLLVCIDCTNLIVLNDCHGSTVS